MAIDNSALQGLMADPNVKNLLSNLGGNMTTETGLGGGVLGAVLIGALLPRLFNDQNGVGTAAAAANAAHVLTTADVQSIVNGNTNTQTLGQVNGEIWKAEGQLQSQLLAQSNAAQLATLNSEIANLQGQGILNKSIADNATVNAVQAATVVAAINATGWENVNAVNATANQTQQAIATTTASLLATTNSLAAQAAANAAAATVGVLQGKYDTLQAIINDGDKTRALIESINLAALNRQIIVADNKIAELLGDRNTARNGIEINTVVSQSQAQAQQQQQAINTNQLLTQLVTSIQHNTQSTVNLGTMIGSGQTATNVRS